MIKNYDDWQVKFLGTAGDKILCTGRQVGKTEVCAEDCRLFVIKTNKKGIILMTAPQEFQAEILFNKTLDVFEQKNPKIIMRGANRPTKTEIKIRKDGKKGKNLKPDIIIICKTASKTGFGLRGITTIRTYVDECSQMTDMTWEAIDPQSLVTGGDTIYISTPFGMQGRFYECWINKDDAYKSFTRFSIDSETCIRNRKISEEWTIEMRNKALEKIERARKRLTKKRFMQEYMGQFIESLMRWYSDEIIKKCCIRKSKNYNPNSKYYLGIDVGGRISETTFEVIEKKGDFLKHVENIAQIYELTTEVERQVIHLDTKYRFKKIYIDSGGIGAGPYSHLIENPQTRKKMIPIDNSKKVIEYTDNDLDKPRKKIMMKVELHENLLNLMEQGKVVLLDDPAVKQSLASVQFEITEEKQLKIYGNYTHIAEGLVRACYCSKDKSLNLWVY